MNLNHMSTLELNNLIDDGVVTIDIISESSRRDYIKNARWQDRQRNNAIMPHAQLNSTQYHVMYQCDRYAVWWHNCHRSMRLDDWNRVVVLWRETPLNTPIYVSYGVSTMHAILVAQVQGMSTVAYPDIVYEASQ